MICDYLFDFDTPGPRNMLTATNTNVIKQWPKLTLYGDLNMRPFRNIWMLEEIGLPYKHIVCKPWSRIAKNVHPLGKVPALLVENYSGGDSKEEKFVLIESAAINTFLGDLARESSVDTHNNKMLVPTPSTPLRAKYDSLSMFIMTELDSQSLWIHRKHEALSDLFGERQRQSDNLKMFWIHWLVKLQMMKKAICCLPALVPWI